MKNETYAILAAQLIPPCPHAELFNGPGRKLAVLVWHLLAKETDYLWARPALVAHKLRALELQAGRPMKKGNQRGGLPMPIT